MQRFRIPYAMKIYYRKAEKWNVLLEKESNFDKTLSVLNALLKSNLH